MKVPIALSPEGAAVTPSEARRGVTYTCSRCRRETLAFMWPRSFRAATARGELRPATLWLRKRPDGNGYRNVNVCGFCREEIPAWELTRDQEQGGAFADASFGLGAED